MIRADDLAILASIIGTAVVYAHEGAGGVAVEVLVYIGVAILYNRRG